jgi:hypothetical protein
LVYFYADAAKRNDSRAMDILAFAVDKKLPWKEAVEAYSKKYAKEESDE